MSLLLDSSGLREPIAERLADGMPAFGTCAGLILLAQQFGAIDLTVVRNGYGRQIDSFETDIDVDGVGSFHAVFIRAPVVERVGDDVTTLASVDGRPVLCRANNILVAAFHPEITGDARIHQLFLEGS